MNEHHTSLQLIDFSFPHNQINYFHHQLIEKYKNLTITRKAIEEGVKIYKKRRKITFALRDNLDYCLKLVNIEGTVLRKLKNQNSRKIVLAAARQNGNSYPYMKKEFKRDVEILLECASSCSNKVAECLLKELDGSIAVEDLVRLMRKLIENCKISHYTIIYHFPECLTDQRELMLSLIGMAHIVFPRLFVRFNNDRDFILEAIGKLKPELSPDFFKDFIGLLSAELKSDKEIILAIVKRDGKSIKYIPKPLQEDRDVIFQAVKQNPHLL